MSLESQPISPVDSTTEFSVPLGIPAEAARAKVEPAQSQTVDSIHAVEHVSMRLVGRHRTQPNNKKTKLAVITLLIATAFAATGVSLSWLHFSQPAEQDSLVSAEEAASNPETTSLSDLRHVQTQTPEKEKYRPHEELGIDLELRPVSDALVTPEDLLIGPVSDSPPVHVTPEQIESTSSEQIAALPPKQASPTTEMQPEVSTPQANDRNSVESNTLSMAATELASSLAAHSTTPDSTDDTATSGRTKQPVHHDVQQVSISDDLDELIQTYRERYLSLKMDGGKQKRYGREYYAAVAELCVWVNAANQVPREVENLVREVATDTDLRTLVQSAASSWVRWPQRASDGVMIAGELAAIDIRDNATVLRVKTGHKGSKTVVITTVNSCDIEVGGQLIALGMIQAADPDQTSVPQISGYVLGH